MSLRIRAVGVIGAGTMGNGIAQVFAAAGYPVTMRDLKIEFLDRGMATITKSLGRLVSHQKLMPEQRDAALSRIRPTIELKELAPCEIIVEAILEDYELKASLIRELDAICSSEAIFATTPHPFRSRRSRRHRAFRAALSACTSSIRCR
jgi:3-hydroxybutyryl-CoA dehydrogenase